MTMRGVTKKTFPTDYNFTEQDHEFMSRAINLAKKGHISLLLLTLELVVCW